MLKGEGTRAQGAEGWGLLRITFARCPGRCLQERRGIFASWVWGEGGRHGPFVFHGHSQQSPPD